MVAFTVFGYVLSRLTDRFEILILKRFQRSSRDGKKPRDKQSRSQHPLAPVPGEKTDGF